jgi:hypothetical protein
MPRRESWMLAGVLAAIMVGLGIGAWQFRTNLSLKASLEIREEANRVPQMSLDERKVQLDRGRIGLELSPNFGDGRGGQAAAVVG